VFHRSARAATPGTGCSSNADDAQPPGRCMVQDARCWMLDAGSPTHPLRKVARPTGLNRKGRKDPEDDAKKIPNLGKLIADLSRS
jgi:hypothetical protein